MSRFSEVFPKLDMDMSDKELLKNAEVLKISVPRDRSSLDIYIRNNEEIPRSTICSAVEAIRDKVFEGKSIRVGIVVTGAARSGNHTAGGTSTAASTGGRQYSNSSSGSGAVNQGGFSGNANGRGFKRPGQTGYKTADTRWTPKQDKKSQNPDVIYGYDFSGEPLSISSLEEGMGDVVIKGKIFAPETIKTRNEKYIIKFMWYRRRCYVSFK